MDKNNNSDAITIAKGTSGLLSGQIFAQALRMLTQVIIARFLGPARFGLYAVGWTLVTTIGHLGLLGMHQGVIRFGTQHRETDRARLKGIFIQTIFIGLSAGLLLGCILFGAAPWIADKLFQMPDLGTVIRLFTPAIFFSNGLSIVAAATRVSLKMRYSVYSMVLTQTIANFGLVIYFYFIGWQLHGAIVASVASFAIAFATSVYHLKILFPDLFNRNLKPKFIGTDLFKYSLPTSFSGVLSRINMRLDRLFIAHFRPAAEVGIYQAISQPCALFQIILHAFATMMAPMMSKLYRDNKFDRLNETIKVATKWCLYISFPLVLVLLFSSKELITFLFGSEYAVGNHAFLVLVVVQLFNVATGPINTVLIMTGHQMADLYISLITLVINIILNILLIPLYGFLGAALATAIANISRFILGLLKVRRSVGLFPYDRRYWKGLIAALVTIVGIFIVDSISIPIITLKLVVMVIMAYSLFASALFFSGLDSEDREYLSWARKRLNL